MFDKESLFSGLLAFYFFWFIFIGPLVFWYLFRRKLFFYAYFVAFIWWCYLWRIGIPLILLSFLGDNIFTDVIMWLSSFFTSLSVLLVFILLIMAVNFLLQGKMLQIVGILLLLPVLWLSSMESKFLFYPLIDTAHSEKFTLKKFKSINPGMTRSEVEYLIGKPHPNAGGYFAGMNGCESQTGDNGSLAQSFGLDFAWLDSAVCYDENDRVTEIKMGYVPD
ncbi:MAG: hypothetical protein KA731_02285 [Candidatus Moranbacteria bacterium]|nr:hypothetical protein [Candidatus Moranbacteria bacterium]MBP6034225.1 hypothetical protein [Candidatus Moranbacteria bacterium]